MKMLRALRKAKGLTLDQLAAEIGVAPNTLSQYETGKREAKYEIQLRLAEALDTSVDYLLTGYVPSTVPEPDSWLLSAYRAAPSEIRAIVDTALAPYREDGLSESRAI